MLQTPWSVQWHVLASLACTILVFLAVKVSCQVFEKLTASRYWWRRLHAR